VIASIALTCALALPQDSLAPRRLDDFERITAWSAHPADGVRMSLHSDPGRRGRALRLDFAFAAGGGYAIARRALPIDLPANYAFSFWMRGSAPPNTLEFKLIDSTAENVWWYTERDRAFDGSWHRITIRKRQIAFAWGPRGGGELTHAAALELVITAGRGGGSGSVWFDDLELTPLADLGPYSGTPVASADAALTGHGAAALVDGDSITAWRAGVFLRPIAVTLDFGRPREFGGLSLAWEPGREARDYDVLLSDDRRTWHLVRRVQTGVGGTHHLYLPDSESRYLRLVCRSAGARGVGLREVIVQPLEFGASRNAFFTAVARTAPRGTYPRAFLGQRAYWTIIGSDGSRVKALLNEDGAVDAGPGAFSLEPFLEDSGLVTWHDVARSARLEDGYLPIPSVEWTTPRRGALRLAITGWIAGPAERPSLVVRYRVTNRGSATRRPTLYIAIRPFQVNPPWQFLGTPGGTARVDSIRWSGSALVVNGDRRVIPLRVPVRVGATTFDQGEIGERLRQRIPPTASAVRDTSGAASAVLAYPLALAPGDSADVALEVPLVPKSPGLLARSDRSIAQSLTAATARWRARLSDVTIDVPADTQLTGAIRASAGWILATRNGAALEPGTRSYDRSWIRDGALMAAALLRFGYSDVVRDYIAWYAPHQYPSGKVPCCVDARGADPVPEHDSNGEFIYLVMEYWRHTGDRALLERMWPHVVRAVAYLDSLRQTRRTPAYRTGDAQVFFGLLPPSISHEGYSAKPMHSYWDDFFALRGFKDAATMAAVLGHTAEATRFAALRDEFETDLLRSLDLAMTQHTIDYLPGAADPGDFDATSTTIALSPVGEESRLPQTALERTFERYWTNLQGRLTDTTWDGYAGYEIRAAGAMLRLGWKARALTLVRTFLDDREPPAWNQWPEVIYRDRHAPKFIGDVPHAWVAADFLRSASDLFAYERESDSALVLGAGLDSTWLGDSGVHVAVHTWWGPLRYSVRREGSTVRFRIEPGVQVPPGGLVVRAPLPGRRAVFVDAAEAVSDSAGGVVVRRVPLDIVFQY
jgi:F5/8 type C domain-containing protein/alpha-L-rhamnosidase-like protein